MTGARTTQDTVTVASVPASHVYIRHLAPEHDDGVRRLADPDPDSPDRSAEQRWWPPVMLRPDWVDRHEFDVFHLQFGFDSWEPGELRSFVSSLEGRPFVQTVHDLRNPHHEDRSLHDRQLDVLVPAADALVTLTPGAAAEIARRWGREAVVLPHPHVVDLVRMGRSRERRPDAAPFRVGLHVKSLRASMDPMAILPQLVRTVRELPNAVLQVNGHRDVLDPRGSRRSERLARYLDGAAAAGDLELHVHDFLGDDQLWDYLSGLDVSVLPYRFGTHSGWLEACRDLGTSVVAPSCGYYADQGPVHTYVHDEERYDAETLHDAVVSAWEAGPIPPLSVEMRRAQRAGLAAAHRELYHRLLA